LKVTGYVKVEIMARPTDRKRDPLSLAVIELRTSLADTQQQFAARLRSALSTVARYETSRPPAGDVLLQLAQIAEKNRLSKLQNLFRWRYVDEAMQKAGFELLFDPKTLNGRVWVKFQGLEQLELANKFLSDLAALKKAGRS
jgi:transcriptional regulator with XRE-family HTH domain